MLICSLFSLLLLPYHFRYVYTTNSQMLTLFLSFFFHFSWPILCCAFNFVCRHLHSCIEIAAKTIVFFRALRICMCLFPCVKSRVTYEKHLLVNFFLEFYVCAQLQIICGYCLCTLLLLIVQRKSCSKGKTNVIFIKCKLVGV